MRKSVATALAAILARPIAHRGLHDRALGIIENSFSAAEAAATAGYAIECDIQLAGDGVAVVFHDDALDRLTGETGPVDARSAAALAAIPLTDSRDTIPSLRSFLDQLAGRVPLVVEVKSLFDGDMRLAEAAVSVVADYDGVLALKSFDRAVMAHCRALGAPCPLGLVGPVDTPGATKDAPQDASDPFDFLSCFDFLSWNVKHLDALGPEAASMPLMSWTIRSPEDQARAARFGAQIVFERFKPI